MIIFTIIIIIIIDLISSCPDMFLALPRYAGNVKSPIFAAKDWNKFHYLCPLLCFAI